MKIKKICKNCLGEFESYTYKQSSLCSKKCKAIWQSKNWVGINAPRFNKAIGNISCFNCKKEFRPRPYVIKKSKKIFCSPHCYHSSRRIKKICAECNKDIILPKHKEKYKNNFCSTKCLQIYRKKQIKEKNNFYGKKHTISTKSKMSLNHADFSGKNNPSYVNGLSYFPYPLDFNLKLREMIRKRDSYTCQECKKIQEHNIVKGKNLRLDVHHIDHNKNNNDVKNLIALCRKCHIQTNIKRDFYELRYKERMGVAI